MPVYFTQICYWLLLLPHLLYCWGYFLLYIYICMHVIFFLNHLRLGVTARLLRGCMAFYPLILKSGFPKEKTVLFPKYRVVLM